MKSKRKKMLKNDDCIRVMCRFRPINDVEIQRGSDIIFKALSSSQCQIQHPDKAHHPQPMSFTFDKIFDPKSIQQDVFKEAAEPLIDNIFEGYNATIFAYGQTGAGKTYTMMGEMTDEIHPRNGIIPRVIDGIWKRIMKADDNLEFELKVSFLEIYNESLYDLLSNKGSASSNKYSRKSRKNKKNKKYAPKLIIRQQKSSNEVFVENLNEIYVRDAGELFSLIKSANKRRISAETKMNKTSSRSHAVLTINLTQYNTDTDSSKKSKFCLVDLAGSEKVGKTQAKGIRLKEATSINRSLTTLGTCMNKLADNNSNINNKSDRHIPFRESMLTFLLSDSLGGNCKTTLIINASPCSYNVEETMSTLRFGARAKKIKTKARINQIKTAKQYRKELQTATSKIQQLYRLIEDCAYDIQNALKGNLSIDNCKSYKQLLDLKKSTLKIINGGGSDKSSNNILANILPNMPTLHSLKKIKNIKKIQQRNQLPALQKQLSNPRQMQQVILKNKASNNAIPSAPTTTPTTTPKSVASVVSNASSTSNAISPNKLNMYDLTNRLKSSRYDSFEELDCHDPVTLIPANSKKNKIKNPLKKKIDPLKKKNTKKDFKFNAGIIKSMQMHIPQFDPSRIPKNNGNTPIFLDNQYIESEYSDYNDESEYDNLSNYGIISPKMSVNQLIQTDDGTYSDVSNCTSYYDQSCTEIDEEFSDYDEDKLPRNFLSLSKDKRLIYAKENNINPTLIEYRYAIEKDIDWDNWNSSDDENDIVDDVNYETLGRIDLENLNTQTQEKLVMLCRLIKKKSLLYNANLNKKVTSLNKLKNKTAKEIFQLQSQKEKMEQYSHKLLNEKEKLHKLLISKQEELSSIQSSSSSNSPINNNKSNMNSKDHQKYAKEYKKIEDNIIKNKYNKDINTRFKDLSKAFKSQFNKYKKLGVMIDKYEDNEKKLSNQIRNEKDRLNKFKLKIREKNNEIKLVKFNNEKYKKHLDKLINKKGNSNLLSVGNLAKAYKRRPSVDHKEPTMDDIKDVDDPFDDLGDKAVHLATTRMAIRVRGGTSNLLSKSAVRIPRKGKNNDFKNINKKIAAERGSLNRSRTKQRSNNTLTLQNLNKKQQILLLNTNNRNQSLNTNIKHQSLNNSLPKPARSKSPGIRHIGAPNNIYNYQQSPSAKYMAQITRTKIPQKSPGRKSGNSKPQIMIKTKANVIKTQKQPPLPSPIFPHQFQQSSKQLPSPSSTINSKSRSRGSSNASVNSIISTRSMDADVDDDDDDKCDDDNRYKSRNRNIHITNLNDNNNTISDTDSDFFSDSDDDEDIDDNNSHNNLLNNSDLLSPASKFFIKQKSYSKAANTQPTSGVAGPSDDDCYNTNFDDLDFDASNVSNVSDDDDDDDVGSYNQWNARLSTLHSGNNIIGIEKTMD